jgi:hypothetical protein
LFSSLQAVYATRKTPLIQREFFHVRSVTAIDQVVNEFKIFTAYNVIGLNCYTDACFHKTAPDHMQKRLLHYKASEKLVKLNRIF